MPRNNPTFDARYADAFRTLARFYFAGALKSLDLGQLPSGGAGSDAAAVMKGDFRTAISEATKVAPPDSEVGKALSVVNSAMKMVPAGIKA
jgi:hypothetical protein